MTKDQAAEFMTEAGHVIEVQDFDENRSRICFKYKGTPISLFSYADDEDYLQLRCSFRLDEGSRDEAEVARILARIQDDLKVAKLGVDLSVPGVYSTAEQFLPQCDEFSYIFWRSVDIVARAASQACRELDTMVAAGTAAGRFTEQMELDMRLASENG
jgi:hypothetical protein